MSEITSSLPTTTREEEVLRCHVRRKGEDQSIAVRVGAWARRGLPAFALALLALAIMTRGIADGGFRYPDASRHAMDGVFVHDVLANLSTVLKAPMEYALHYYAQYPALGFGLYYPPMFAMVEAAFFAVFGVSALAARLTVAAYGVLGVVMMYKLIGLMAGRRAAVLATVSFISLPLVVKWSRCVMLEMPTVATALAAVYFFYRYVGERKPGQALLCGLFVLAAIMTKQMALYLLPVFGLYILLKRRWDLLRRWELWASLACVLAVVVPYFLLTFRHAHYLTRKVGGDQFFSGMVGLTVRNWAAMFTWPGLLVIAAAAVAAVCVPAVRRRAPGALLLVVLGACFFLESVYVQALMPRYAFMVAPFLAALPFVVAGQLGWLRRKWVFAPLALAVLVMAGLAYAQPVRRVAGYEEAVRSMFAVAGDSRFVLFDGYYDGDAVFYARQLDPGRKRYLLRGSKMLYAYGSFKHYGYRDLVADDKALATFMNEYGIGAVAVEDLDLAETEPGRLLRQTLVQSPRFELVEEIPVDAPRSALDELNLLVYRVKDPLPPTAETLEVPMVGLHKLIRVPVTGKAGATIEPLQMETSQ